MNDQQVHAYHARRLLVAPPRKYRVQVGPNHRTLRILRELVNYGFVIIYAALSARLLLLLLPGTVGHILTRMVSPLADPLAAPLVGVVPELVFLGDLAILPPVAIALCAYALAHRGLSTVLQVLSRPRLGRPSALRQGSLLHSVGPTDRMQPVSFRAREPYLAP